MKTRNLFKMWALAALSIFAVSSCDDDDTVWVYGSPYANALVTVKPLDDGNFYMQLNDSVALFPTNVSTSPYGNKEVRALVNCYEVGGRSAAAANSYKYSKSVYLNWMDSILTKNTVAYPSDGDLSKYGNDPIEIVKDWVNIAEDGYLTLRFRTKWGNTSTVHFVNLVTGADPEDPYEVEFLHNAYGDVNGAWGDALVAYKLDGLPDTEGKTVTLTLKYNSFSGEKKITFDYCSRKSYGTSEGMAQAERSSRVK